MWIGASIFLALCWGFGLGADVGEYGAKEIKTVRKVGER